MLDRPPLSLSLLGLESAEGVPGDPRAAIEWAASVGYRGVQIDATRSGIRPRELDRSARRDLAALLRRCELSLSGLDLFIPSGHFTDAAHVDRAIAAVRDALELIAEMRVLVPGSGDCLSVTLPVDIAQETCDELASVAERLGVFLADHTIGAPYESRHHAMGIGLDPAAVLLASGDPVQRVAQVGSRLNAARLSDAAGGVRVEPGSPGGVLDVTAYCVAISVVGFSGPLVLDLRGLAHPAASARLLQSSDPA